MGSEPGADQTHALASKNAEKGLEANQIQPVAHDHETNVQSMRHMKRRTLTYTKIKICSINLEYNRLRFYYLCLILIEELTGPEI